MYKAGTHLVPAAALPILFCLLLAGCLGGGTKATVRYYLVDPVPVAGIDTHSQRQLALEIIDFDIPQYLQRFQLVTRDGDNRLRLSDSNQWAENLRKNLLRTMAINLAARLSTIDVGTPLNRSASLPDYRIQVSIARFELDRAGMVQLAGRWQIIDANGPRSDMHEATLQSDASIKAGDYDRIVSDMQILFGKFCDRIAASIRMREDAR